MISATPSGSRSHPLSIPTPAHSVIDLENGRRHHMDSQKFLVPSLPVSSRITNNESASKRRERSIINGTAHPNEGNYSMNGNNFSYVQHQNVNGSRRYQHHNDFSSTNNYSRSHNNTELSLNHQTMSPKKDADINSLYNYHQGVRGSLNDEISQRSRHQISNNPSNYNHLSRSLMPVPCSSPAAASSASPKALSPATNGSENVSNNHSYSPHLPNVPSLSPNDPSFNSPLRFYPGGLPHPNHPVSFYAAAAAAAAASHHHGIPYPLFGAPYTHSAVASSYLDNFHSTLLHQHQQQGHIKSTGASPSPPSRSVNVNFPSHSPLHSPDTSKTSLHGKQNGSVKVGESTGSGRYNSTHSSQHPYDHSLNTYDQGHTRAVLSKQDNDNIRFASMLCSGLSKGGPLGIGNIDNSTLHHSASVPRNLFQQKETPSLSITPLNDARNTNSISSKFWNIDSSLTTASTGKIKTSSPAERDLRMEKGNHPNHVEAFDLMNNNKQFLNGKEGSLKHRILTRSPDQTINSPIRNKMSKTVFTFPENVNESNNSTRQASTVKEKHQNNSIANNNDVSSSSIYQNGKINNTKISHPSGSSLSFFFPNHKQGTNGQLNYPSYPSLSNSDLLPSPLSRTQSIASTITTDSAKYLSQIQKPSIHSSSQSQPTSPYLSPNNAAQNLPSPRTPKQFFNNTSNNGNASKSLGVPQSPNNHFASSSSPVKAKTFQATPLPVEQMPVIQAFKKGSLIQLASGQLRPVEELRAEDFHCAAATKADSLRIVHCTVIAIQSNSIEDQFSCKVILAVGAQQQQVVMATTPAQPFFVLGRGWASWSPETTEKVLQLPCTPLNVGDVCITLTKMSRKSGRNSGKLNPIPKSPTTKYKSSTTSILSAVPRRTDASKILKVSNGNIVKQLNGAKSKPSSPKSANKVKFEQTRTPVTPSSNCLSSMLPPPSPLNPLSQETNKVSPKVADSSDQKFRIDNLHRDEPPRPKKRRWSAPEVNLETEKNEPHVPAQPKRPISHSPVVNLP